MQSLSYTSSQAMASSRRWVFGCMLALLGIGVVMAYSADVVEQMQAGRDLELLADQLLQVGLALAGFLVAMRVRPTTLYQASRLLYGLAIVLLVSSGNLRVLWFSIGRTARG